MLHRNLFRLSPLLACGIVSACAMPTLPTPDFAGATHAAHEQADAVGDKAEERLPGVNEAVKAPLRDLNLVNDDVPVVLVHAYAKPYDSDGLTTCAAVNDQVAALDLALGPDVDIPRTGLEREGMFAKGRDMAGDAALDAVRSATTGVIPVRSWVRRFSGANQAEKEAKAIVLSGEVRRGFLKAIGLELHCDWPAAPLNLRREAQKASDAAAAAKAAAPATPPETMASTPPSVGTVHP